MLPHWTPLPSSSLTDPMLIDTLKRCLVRNPRERASVDELLEHEYASAAQARAAPAPAPAKAGKENLSALLGELGSVLTPNTRRGLTRAMEKLGGGATAGDGSSKGLEALRKLNIENTE